MTDGHRYENSSVRRKNPSLNNYPRAYHYRENGNRPTNVVIILFFHGTLKNQNFIDERQRRRRAHK